MTILRDAVRPRPTFRGSSASSQRLLTAVTALFAFDGAVFGSWAARIPDVTSQVGASHTTLGLSLLCVSVGALASMQLTGALCARLGPGLGAAASAVMVCVAVALPGLADTLPELAVALLAFGAATGAVNVAANSVGIHIEAAARTTWPCSAPRPATAWTATSPRAAHCRESDIPERASPPFGQAVCRVLAGL